MRILAASVLALSTTVAAQAKVDRPPQFVLLAFDGSRNIDFWKKSRAFARETDVRFTYFISGVYFLAQKDRKTYREPKRGRGRSAIGYGGKPADISERVEQVALAISEGHEIASHANGHYNGANYSQSQWKQELNQFETIMADSWSRYSKLKEPDWWRDYFTKEVKGIRAPELGRGPGLFKALKTKGYHYDTSRTARLDYWPEKINGVWNFPLAHVRIAGSRRGTLSMDYNFYVADSGARRGPSGSFGRYEERMFNTYMNYFRHNYSGGGNRAPIDIGHHFSSWNGGAYWRAMKRFTRAVCGKPEVICGTYSELYKFVEENREHLDDYRKGNFERASEPSALLMAYAKPPKISNSYKRVEPVVAVAALEKPQAVALAKVIKPSNRIAKPKVSKSKRVIFDAGLRRPNLSAMTEAEVKAYWTLVWYANQGKKIPDDEARALGIPVENQPPVAPPQNKPVAKLVVANAKTKAQQAKEPSRPATPKLAAIKVSDQAKVESDQVAIPVPVQKPAATGVAKLTKPAKKSEPVVAKKPKPTASKIVKLNATSATKKKARKKPRQIYDAGLLRPNLAAMNDADRKAYWTRVWYARRDLRAKKQAGS